LDGGRKENSHHDNAVKSDEVENPQQHKKQRIKSPIFLS
jgi:hypothetical protein